MSEAMGMTAFGRSHTAELMDTDCVDAADYAACLADLAKVNTFTLARGPTLAFLTRATRKRGRDEAISVFDVAYGHGDMLRTIARWAKRRRRSIRLGGVDMNPAAAAAARAASPGLTLDLATGDVLTHEPAEPYDYIVSSLFTHHLTDIQIIIFLEWMEKNAKYGWFINDLHRHRLPYHGFRLLAWAMRWHRFVRHDGPVSIMRSFTPSEWRNMLHQAGVPAEIRWRFPFRVCITRLK